MLADQSNPPTEPDGKADFTISCKDVVMGRGSGAQNHCGNVTYRKLVYLNKELYATSSKFDKLKISKAIVAAIRIFGGRFLEAEEGRGLIDIGDKRAWDKTSQALREGQTEVRARLAEERENAPTGSSKVAEYMQVISEQAFVAFACKVLESLYEPTTGSLSCGPTCAHAKRRSTLNRDQSLRFQSNTEMPQQPNHLPPYPNYDRYNHHSSKMPPPYGSSSVQAFPSPPHKNPDNNLDSYEPLPYKPTIFHRPHMHNIQPVDHSLNLYAIEPSKDSMSTLDSDALRMLLSDHVCMESDELSRQLSGLISRKSDGLIRIDVVEAFEDLVYEEDSTCGLEFPDPQVENAIHSNRGESLMNMSLLTVDDGNDAHHLTATDGPKRPSRVSFDIANVSAMSLNANDGAGDETSCERNDTSNLTSRKLGFPVRSSIMEKYAAGIPSVIGAKSLDEIHEPVRSTLTRSDLSVLQRDIDDGLTEMARKVAPPTSDYSLKFDNMSLSNMSLMSILKDDEPGDFTLCDGTITSDGRREMQNS